MTSLYDHPGYLGYGGVLAIHADWPAYPMALDWQSALLNIGHFPINAKFFKIDDIDLCVLFITRDPNQIKDDVYSPNYFHLAIWHENLNELQAMGFIEGTKSQTQYEYEIEKFDRMIAEQGYETNSEGNIEVTRSHNGKNISNIIKRPTPSDYERDGFTSIENYMRLTENGVKEIERLSKECRISEDIWAHSSPLISIKKYDTAIRETVLYIETRIRSSVTGLKNQKPLHGNSLIEALVSAIEKKYGKDRAWIKIYRNELRCLFSYTRNEFMHNFKDLEEGQTKVILSKIDSIYQKYLELEVALKKNDLNQ